jgi:metal-dependent amidase/aminoacylase/carboxypeptidase family protein
VPLTSDLITRFSAGIDRLGDDLIEIRRELHAHPELSWHEERTTALVAKRLDAGSRSGRRRGDRSRWRTG